MKRLTYKGKNTPWEIIWTHCDLVFHQENLCKWKYGLSRQALKFVGLFFQIRQEKISRSYILLDDKNQVSESPWPWIVTDHQGFFLREENKSVLISFKKSYLTDSFISFTLKLESRQNVCSNRSIRSSTYGTPLAWADFEIKIE